MGGNYILGVDFGSSNTRATVIKDGKAVMIPFENGETSLPSVFALSSNQEPLIGHLAAERADRDPVNTIFSPLRMLGRGFNSQLVRWAKISLPYQLCPGPDGAAWAAINDQAVSFMEISAYIIAHVKDCADSFLGETVTKTVFAVPAHYNSPMRQALKQIALIAGFKTVSILNATTAAGLALWHAVDPADLKDERRIVAVADMGGARFNTAILALTDTNLEVISAASDPTLGGDDFDTTYLMHLAQKFMQRHGIDLSMNPDVLHRTRILARQGKHDLSKDKTAAVNMPYIAAAGSNLSSADLSINIDRRESDTACKALLDRISGPLVKMLNYTEIEASAVNDLLLVGGMTKVLAVRSKIVDFFDIDPVEGFDPMTAVAVGAAVQGALLKGEISNFSFSEVTPAALSIETQSGSCVPIIAENTPVPVSASLRLSTAGPDQTEVTLGLLQGNSEFAEDNISLGLISLEGIKPAARGIPNIEVGVSIDQDGVVVLTGKNCDSDNEVSATMSAEHIGIQKDLLKHIAKKVSRKGAEESRKAEQLKKNEDADADLSSEEVQELNVLREELRRSVFATGFKLEMEGEHFRGPERDALDRALEQGRQLSEGMAETDDMLKTIEAIKKGCEAFDAHLADFS